MATESIPHPPIASREEWLARRKQLLAHEKELTKHHDRVAAERRRLPMVRLEKEYIFEGPSGKVALRDLFEGQRQLIVYHFMFDPEWEKGCPGCTGLVDALGDLSMLKARNTHYVLISRAPLSKLEAYKAAHGWNRPWYSSFGTDFNYDFHVTLDEKVAPIEYNYRSKEELLATESPSQSKVRVTASACSFGVGDDVYHTYSSYARGCENLTDSYSLLDTTPFGRQEDWEDSPSGWPQKPTYG